MLFKKSSVFRISHWWQSKVANLVAILFLIAWQSGFTFEIFAKAFPFAICTIFGLAAFGYLVNDYYDLEKDAIAKKKNFLQGKSSKLILLLSALTLVFAFAPWFYFPTDKVVFTLLGFEILLFFLYAHPFIRWKEKGIFSWFIDALYAHVIPAILAAYTYGLIAGKQDYFFLGLLAVWQLFTGMKNIAQHQIFDARNDLASSTYNPFNSKNKKYLLALIPTVLIPLELLSFCILLLQIQWGIVVLISAIIALLDNFLIIRNFKLKTRNIKRFKLGLYSFNFFYEKRLGYYLIILFSFYDLKYLFFLLLLFVLFDAALQRIFYFFKYLGFLVHEIYAYTYHHIFLKYGYYWGHKIKKLLGIAKNSDE